MRCRFDRGRREEVPIDGFTDAMTQNYGGELGGSPERWQKIVGGTDCFRKRLHNDLARRFTMAQRS
jgi:hypothetical protein